MKSSFCLTFCLQVAISHALACYNTCFYLHDRFSFRKLFLVRHCTLHILSWWAEPIHIWIWMPNMKNFTTNNTICFTKTDIVTLISYRHYLKSVGNNKLWPDMQKESWNIHLTKTLICFFPYVEWDRFVTLTGASKLKFSLSEYFNFLFAYLVITYYSLHFLSNGDTK
jgi:hypothetical protein